jgi:hypothetical protein
LEGVALKDRIADSTWNSIYGLFFWLALATIVGTIFYYGFLPARAERQEQIRDLDALKKEARAIELENENGHLINQAIENNDEGVIRHFLHEEGYVQQGRGIVLLEDSPEVELGAKR